MEWVETTARTIEEAKELALDELGVVADEAEFEVLAEPKQGLFGRLRGEARVRARVRPAPVRPKQERRRGARTRTANATATDGSDDATSVTGPDEPEGSGPGRGQRSPDSRRRRDGGGRDRSSAAAPPAVAAAAVAVSVDADDVVPAPTPTPVASSEGHAMTTEDLPITDPEEHDDEPVDVGSVRDAAVAFMSGLTTAFGYESTVDSSLEGTEIEVRVDGESLGLLIGPGGRTLLAIQDLARVAAQRRLGDHETRLRVDVAGYREKRRAALERFADTVAAQVRESGVARSLDPMPSADRKVLHDALGGDRRRDEPLGGRGPVPPRRRHPGLISREPAARWTTRR